MKQVIRLPNGRIVSLATYADAWRKLVAMPADAMVKGWDHFPTEAGAILREMRRGLQDRINKRGGYVVPTSRVHPCAWGYARTARVRIEPHHGRTFPPAARRALADRIHAFEH